MTTARLPVPSLGLLRYLRSQSENLSFFSPSHGVVRTAGHASPRVRQYRGPQGRCCAFVTKENTSLRAGIFDFGLLVRSKNPRAAAKKPPFFTPAIRFQYNSADDKRSGQFGSPWRERLFGSGSSNYPKDDANRLRPDDLPELDGDFDSNSMFNNHRQLSKKAALEPRLRCTEVDENGQAIVVDGEFKKSELIARFGLLPRDLRKIDSSNLPHILVRPTAILLNLLHLRVLIKHNRVLLFDVYGSKSSYPQSAFMYDLQHKLQQKSPASNGGLPYEFRALEAVLQSVTQELESDFETVRDPVIRILSELEDDVDRQKLRILLILSKRVSTFSQKATLVRDALEELLEADDDLRDMYLTEKMHDLYRDVDQHTEIEMLLESYHKLCDEIVQEASNLVSGIRNTEEIIRAILDANRNALMLLDLRFSVGTLGLAMGTFIAGLYGANLENFIEETNWGFGAVTAVSTILSIWVCIYGLRKLNSVQRVKMQGNDNVGGGLVENFSIGALGKKKAKSPNPYHWFHDDGHVGLLDPRNREKLRRLNMMKQTHNQSKKRWW